MTRYWMGVVSREHVLRGVAGGFVQLNHGKRAPLRKIGAGDWLVFYLPKTAYPDGESLQRFTAIGRIRTGKVYQVDMGGGFEPNRMDVDFVPSRKADIRPLIPSLDFIRDKKRWGAAFRFGQIEIPEPDFRNRRGHGSGSRAGLT